MFEYRFALLIAVATVGLIVFGGVVHNTESSLACPDWPLCYGELLPDRDGGVGIEMGHRMTATGVGLLTIVLALAAALRRRYLPQYRRWTWVALLLVVVQGGFGALTVLLRLPTFASTVHLAVSILYLSVLIRLAVRGEASTWPRPSAATRAAAGRAVGWLGAAAGLIYLQMLLGAFVRHTGSGAAAGLGPGAAFIGIDPATGLHALWPVEWPGRLNMLHRGFAVVVAGFALVAGTRAVRVGDELRDGRLTIFGTAVMAFVLLQVVLGVLSIESFLGVGIVSAHLAAGTLLYASALAGWLHLRSLQRPRDDRVVADARRPESVPVGPGRLHGQTG
jgi:heme A synthase